MSHPFNLHHACEDARARLQFNTRQAYELHSSAIGDQALRMYREAQRRYIRSVNEFRTRRAQRLHSLINQKDLQQ